jgi:ABC-2 type transport system permease protein
MKEFIGFVRKEFLHILRDPRTLVVLFGMPVAMILIFGFVIRNDIQDVKIAILDESKDPVTREITQKIVSSGFFRLEKNLNHESEIEEAFRSGQVREVLFFEDHFAEGLEREQKANIQILADASDPNSAKMIVSYTQAIISDYLKEQNRDQQLPYVIEPRVRMMYNADMKSAYMFVPGTMALILTLVSAMMTSISITREKETGTLEAILVSPLRPVQIIAGKVTPYVVLSCINAVVIILLGHFVFGLPVHGSLTLLFTETILFISVALSLGIMISTLAANQMVAMFISALGLMLPTMLLSNFIFPIANMPLVLQWLCHLMPPTYFISIVRSIMLKGSGIAEIWLQTLILTGMLVLFLSISAARFKVRLQ